LWGNSAFAFVPRLADSFARTRWCLNIAGDEFGKVEGLDLTTTGARVIPTEVLVTDRRESDLVRHGFLPLTVHKGVDTAAFYAAQSIQQVADDGEGHAAAILSRKLGAQLPYLFIVSRLAHYIKMMQREHIGSWSNSADIERQVNEWLKQYISDMDNPAASVRARRPLRRARLSVREVEGKGDWYLLDLKVMPHLKYMGSSFTLSELGKLDKN
jgi:type VI secretion system protein ImpC